ncbi:uncharacterized protein LOC141911359 [Tubulanus polymorphus]|uniref:uncharacterized protein LOC141911359 n=1 Tax=Tubulanus polymorphus TaxID=672921 RepID=UPI003DA361C0
MATMVEEIDDVPPLEDMTETLKQVLAVHDTSKAQMDAQKKKETMTASSIPDKSSNDVEMNSKPCTVKKDRSAGFAGMKKGFLLSSSSSTKPKPKKSVEKDNIPFIKAKQETKESKYEMPEVQAAMQASQGLLSNKEWITDNLLESVEKNPLLCSQITDPKISEAMNEFQTNPQEAMWKYRNDEEVQKFFKEFCGLLGNHFTGLSESQAQSTVSSSMQRDGTADIQVRSSTNPNQPTQKDEDKMNEILSKPEVKEVLADPEIQQLFKLLREDPTEAQRILHQKKPSIQSKIQVLVREGLLKYQ